MSTWTFTVTGDDIEELEAAALVRARGFFGDRVDKWSLPWTWDPDKGQPPPQPLVPADMDFTVSSVTSTMRDHDGVICNEVLTYEAEVTVEW